MKKFLSVLMSVVIVLSLFSMLSITSFAEVSGDFEYRLCGDSSCRITKYTGTQTDVTVPDSIGGYAVTEIGDYSFTNTNVEYVTLPDSVTYIGNYAFANCVYLLSCYIPENVKEIGINAFFGCDSLAFVAVPPSVTYIGEHALGYCYRDYSDNPYKFAKYINFSIIGIAGTEAEKYAKQFGFPFIALNENPNTTYMYRLYNPNSGEHFYTSDLVETLVLIVSLWNFEGVGWVAPNTSSTPVYRLYNQGAGEHHFTTDINERNWLISIGWNDEGIGWYSDDAKAVPLYRQYNPNAFANNHNFTADKAENDWLIGLGWNYEGIGWYGIA